MGIQTDEIAKRRVPNSYPIPPSVVHAACNHDAVGDCIHRRSVSGCHINAVMRCPAVCSPFGVSGHAITLRQVKIPAFIGPIDYFNACRRDRVSRHMNYERPAFQRLVFKLF